MNPDHLHTLVTEEISKARSLLRDGRHDQAMRHLERAHVLGQRFVRHHVLVHGWMLRVAIARRAPLDAIGQLVRIAIGALGSAIEVVPVGNTGGSDVSMFQPMPIPPDLAKLMEGGGHA